MTVQTTCPVTGRAGPPVYDVDFYADDVIRAPWEHYRRMRELGPIVWLPRHGNFAVTRHAEAQQILRDWRIFSSAQGVAADDAGCAFLRGNTLASDPPVHDEMRKVMGEPLLPRSLKQWQEPIQAVADALVESLLSKENFDGMGDFARILPLSVVTDLVGLPDDGRENMLSWAAASFDILGVQNERGRNGIETIKEMRHWIATRATSDRLKPGSWTARICDLADRGAIPASFAPQLIRDYINPSLDTTISASGQLLYRLGRNPDQWERLKADPFLISPAINEAVRLASPIRTFSRTLTQDATIGDVALPAGARIMVLFACANRDERRFSDPDRFDVGRDNADHLGFGYGIHTCVGMHLARMEMEALLRAMLPRVERIEVGEPTIALNNTIYTFATLPAAFTGVSVGKDAESADSSAATLKVVVQARADAADGIVSFNLVARDGAPLPPFAAGAHVDVHLPGGLTRQYSVCSDPADRSCYRFGVLREPNSRGGSVAVHADLQNGVHIEISPPRNLFALDESAGKSILLAGGIGITPIISMTHRLHALGKSFELHYAVRSRTRAAFLSEMLASPFAARVFLYVDDEPEGPRFDMAAAIGPADAASHLYCCGPAGFIDAATDAAGANGWAVGNVHVERFAATARTGDAPLRVIARRSGITVSVSEGETILEALRAHGIEVETSCEAGACGTCLVDVLRGTPDHRDMFQTDEEKASGKQIAVCCSRALTQELILDI